MGKVGKYSVSTFDTSSKVAASDPELIALLQESWNAKAEDSKRGAGFAVPIAELDEKGDYDRAVRKLRAAAAELDLGVFARHAVDEDGVECVGFAAQVKRNYKPRS